MNVLFDCCPALLDCYQPECTFSVLISKGILSSRDEAGILSAGSWALFPGAGFSEVVRLSVELCLREPVAAPQAQGRKELPLTPELFLLLPFLWLHSPDPLYSLPWQEEVSQCAQGLKKCKKNWKCFSFFVHVSIFPCSLQC